MLHLVPARAQWPELEYDDVVEGIAAGARRQGTPWAAATTRTAGLIAGGLVLAVALVGTWLAGPTPQHAAWSAS